LAALQVFKSIRHLAMAKAHPEYLVAVKVEVEYASLSCRKCWGDDEPG
jgi:hypothetical protein